MMIVNRLHIECGDESNAKIPRSHIEPVPLLVLRKHFISSLVTGIELKS